MKRKLLLLFVPIVVSFVSCNINDIESTPANDSNYYNITNDLSVLKEDVANYIESSDADGSLIVFSNETPEGAIPKVGSNIVVPVSQNVPYGLLVKVLSVSREDKINVKTQAITLEEAFEYLSIDSSVDVSTELEGIYDNDGKPIEYEIVDTTEISKADTSYVPMHKAAQATKSDFNFDWNWKSECLKFPVKMYKGNSGKDKIAINGLVYVGFDKFDFDIDVNNYKVKYINLAATPYIKLAVESAVSTESKLELEDRIGQLRFKVKFLIPTPVGVPIPVIIPVSLYIYGTCGIRGELSAKLGLQYKYNCNCVATYKNGQWNSDVTHGGFANKNPWTVGEFDVKGEIYSGARLGLIVGLYSATTGIGFNLKPNFSISADAKLESENLLKANPVVGLNLKVGSDVYCVAKLFGRDLGKYSIESPDFTFWETSMYLLPNIENFTATGASSSADISWSHNGLYFLEPLGVKTGTTIFESDQTTEQKSYTPSPTSKNQFGYCTYNVNATGLKSGNTYYAAPFASLNDFKWYGDKKELTTEAGYTICWRCQGREDIWSLHIDLNSKNTEINMTFDAPTYTGQTKRYLVANYNPDSQYISGTVETLFYDAPEDRRIDGFSLDLSVDDTGYVTNSKVLDNGACYTQIRFIKDSSTDTNTKSGFKHIKDDSEGLEPCHYGERKIK